MHFRWALREAGHSRQRIGERSPRAELAVHGVKSRFGVPFSCNQDVDSIQYSCGHWMHASCIVNDAVDSGNWAYHVDDDRLIIYIDSPDAGKCILHGLGSGCMGRAVRPEMWPRPLSASPATTHGMLLKNYVKSCHRDAWDAIEKYKKMTEDPRVTPERDFVCPQTPRQQETLSADRVAHVPKWDPWAVGEPKYVPLPGESVTVKQDANVYGNSGEGMTGRFDKQRPERNHAGSRSQPYETPPCELERRTSRQRLEKFVQSATSSQEVVPPDHFLIDQEMVWAYRAMWGEDFIQDLSLIHI